MKAIKVGGFVALALWMTLRTLHAFGAETALDEAVSEARTAIEEAQNSGEIARGTASQYAADLKAMRDSQQTAERTQTAADQALAAAKNARETARTQLDCIKDVNAQEAACNAAFEGSGVSDWKAVRKDYLETLAQKDTSILGGIFSRTEADRRRKEIEGALESKIEDADRKLAKAKEAAKSAQAATLAAQAKVDGYTGWDDVKGQFVDPNGTPLVLRDPEKKKRIHDAFAALTENQKELGLDQKLLTLDLQDLVVSGKLNEMEFGELKSVLNDALDKAALGQYVMEKINAANKSDAFCQNVAACANPSGTALQDIFKAGVGADGSPATPMLDGKSAKARDAK